MSFAFSRFLGTRTLVSASLLEPLSLRFASSSSSSSSSSSNANSNNSGVPSPSLHRVSAPRTASAPSQNHASQGSSPMAAGRGAGAVSAWMRSHNPNSPQSANPNANAVRPRREPRADPRRTRPDDQDDSSSSSSSSGNSSSSSSSEEESKPQRRTAPQKRAPRAQAPRRDSGARDSAGGAPQNQNQNQQQQQPMHGRPEGRTSFASGSGARRPRMMRAAQPAVREVARLESIPLPEERRRFAFEATLQNDFRTGTDFSAVIGGVPAEHWSHGALQQFAAFVARNPSMDAVRRQHMMGNLVRKLNAFAEKTR